MHNRAPKRIQRRRTKGWRMPEGSIAADRSTRFLGNPFPVCACRTEDRSQTWMCGTWNGPGMWFSESKRGAQKIAVEAYQSWISQPAQQRLRDMIKLLARGHDLACWCKLCQEHAAGKPLGVHCDKCEPCHVDPMLEIANA